MKKSESIKNLAIGLLKFHAEVSKVSKDAKNPFFKSNYASLSNIQDAIREPLQTAGLVYSQLPVGENELTTLLLHAATGEWLESTYQMNPVKPDPQAKGSAITYARRYALAAILGINVDDDDGNTASAGRTTTAKPTAKKKTAIAQSMNWITAEIWKEWEGGKIEVINGLNTLKIKGTYYKLPDKWIEGVKDDKRYLK